MTAIIVALITTAGVIAAALINRAAVLKAAEQTKPAAAPLTREEQLQLWAEHLTIVQAVIDAGEQRRKVRQLPRPDVDEHDVDEREAS